MISIHCIVNYSVAFDRNITEKSVLNQNVYKMVIIAMKYFVNFDTHLKKPHLVVLGYLKNA